MQGASSSNGIPSGVRGVCPVGWHVPSDAEWTALTNFIGGTGSPHGNELKSCRQIDSPLGESCNTSEHPRWHADDYNWGTDDYGFSALPGGLYDNGSYSSLGTYGTWWSSTNYSHSTTWAWYWVMTHNHGNVSHYGANHETSGFSVRCLRE